ncbi:MAG: 23S rRNA (adenine(2503)-C(2))-methyltransferase RlmN [Candidatus Omnitrophica bacterium]|nr:23S rRNA (adenine(2503)-C(2))-methyltransferase RlmN [Candidatus Omnitrophota bacterium]
MKDIKNYTLEELRKLLEKGGCLRFSAQQIFNWIYKRRIEDFNLMTDISKQTRQFLKDNFYFSRLKLLKREISKDKTEKFLFGLEDNSCIESVLISQVSRLTLCISTQVGCKFGCKFCLSGKDGFRRNLKVCEITNQYLTVADLIAPRKITNIVFMGIGEPLDNFANTVCAVKIFTHPQGVYFGKRKICLSTCGLVPQIKKLADLNLGVKLSISLHSPDEAARSKIMPINKKYPLSELIKAVKDFNKKEKRHITFEYVLVRGLNTSKVDAQKLSKLLRGVNYKINLISFNYTCARKGACFEFKVPTEAEINSFKNELKKKGVFFTLRKSKGADINAACGQLRALFKNR